MSKSFKFYYDDSGRRRHQNIVDRTVLHIILFVVGAFLVAGWLGL